MPAPPEVKKRKTSGETGLRENPGALLFSEGLGMRGT